MTAMILISAAEVYSEVSFGETGKLLHYFRATAPIPLEQVRARQEISRQQEGIRNQNLDASRTMLKQQDDIRNQNLIAAGHVLVQQEDIRNQNLDASRTILKQQDDIRTRNQAD